MSKIEELLTTLTFANKNCDDKNCGGGGDDKDPKDKTRRNRRDRDGPEQRYQNMGRYCYSCKFHPVGKEHTSTNCGWKRKDHDDNATWTNRGANGSTFWPSTWRVREDEKTHASYAGKSAPTN